MIDISDGLAADLGHLVEASGVGFILDHLPLEPGATLEEGLGGGEDYELLMASPDPDRLRAAFVSAGLSAPVDIGVCTGDVTDRLLAGSHLEVRGWEHRWET
jgi:thiamine-monophosphate kinase